MRPLFIMLQKSHRPDKKYDAILEVDGVKHTVPFGAKKEIDGKWLPYSDFTVHKDEARKQRYITRHNRHEDWTAAGILTPGFWSRWILWNRPTLKASLADTLRRFGL